VSERGVEIANGEDGCNALQPAHAVTLERQDRMFFGENDRMTAPRVFGIVASDATVVGVLRRGPSDWFHVGRWDTERGSYEPGAWVRATIYPQRCDVSPDGRWLSYFMLGGAATWAAGSTFVAISKLPWVHALAAWGTDGTWTRGAHFVADRRVQELGPPHEGVVDAATLGCGLAVTRPVAYAVERRHGWEEAPGSPERHDGDPWNERRAHRLVMRKSRSGGDHDSSLELRVRGSYAAFRQGEAGNGSNIAEYELLRGPEVVPLTGVQWADWDRAGRLIVATIDGHLQTRNVDGNVPTIVDDVDLTAFAPDPRPAPPEARRW
jgi:hypothetical protein